MDHELDLSSSDPENDTQQEIALVKSLDGAKGAPASLVARPSAAHKARRETSRRTTIDSIPLPSYSPGVIAGELDNLAHVSRLRDDNAILRQKLQEKDDEVEELAEALMTLRSDMESMKSRSTIESMKELIRKNRELQRGIAREKGLVATITQERDRLKKELEVIQDQVSPSPHSSSSSSSGARRAMSASTSAGGTRNRNAAADLSGVSGRNEGFNADDSESNESLRRRVVTETQRATRLSQQVSVLQAEISKYRAILIRELGPPPRSLVNTSSSSNSTTSTNSSATPQNIVGIDGEATLSAVISAFHGIEGDVENSSRSNTKNSNATSSNWPWTWENLAQYSKEQNGWRGRAETIGILKNKLKEIQSELRQLQAQSQIEQSEEFPPVITPSTSSNLPLRTESAGATSRGLSALAAAGANSFLTAGASSQQSSQLQKLSQENEQLRQDSSSVRERARMQKARNESLNREIADLKEKMHTLLEKCDADDALIDALTDSKRELENRINSAEMVDQHKIQEKLNMSEQNLAEKESQIKLLADEVHRLRSDVDNLKKIRTVFVKNHVKTWMLEEGQRARELIEQELQIAKQANKTLSSKLDSALAQCQEAVTDCHNAKARIKTLERRIGNRDTSSREVFGDSKVGAKEQIEALMSEKLLITQTLTDTLHRKDEQVEELTLRLENERTFHQKSIESLQSRIDAILAGVAATGFYFTPGNAQIRSEIISNSESISPSYQPDEDVSFKQLVTPDQSRDENGDFHNSSRPATLVGQSTDTRAQKHFVPATGNTSLSRTNGIASSSAHDAHEISEKTYLNRYPQKEAKSSQQTQHLGGANVQYAKNDLSNHKGKDPAVTVMQPIQTDVDVARMVEMLMQQDFD